MRKLKNGSYRIPVRLSPADGDFLQRRFADCSFVDAADYLQAIVNSAIDKEKRRCGEHPPDAQANLKAALFDPLDETKH